MPKRKLEERSKKPDRANTYSNSNEKDISFGNVNKSNLVLEDFKNNPSCPHGPKVCFEKEGKKFFSCSAFRSPKECQQNSEGIRDKVSNSGIAQYLFSEESTEFLGKMLKGLGLKNFLCVGVPSVHGKLLGRGLNSFLLDLDVDMINRYPGTSSHYNMCNHYFFGGDASYREFLERAEEDLTVILDPPFSAKPELLSHVHGLIQKDWGVIRSDTGLKLNFFWIAPYFLEGHIKKANPELVMSDYKINYDNHASFSKGAKRSRKHGSPIRFFTNIPLSRIQLPETEYKFCNLCDKFVSNTNRHCKKCGDCTSKDGQTYKHCSKCTKCVKPTWSHCNRCNKCALTAGHSC